MPEWTAHRHASAEDAVAPETCVPAEPAQLAADADWPALPRSLRGAMMDRRAVLAGGLAALAALSGCSKGGDSGGITQRPRHRRPTPRPRPHNDLARGPRDLGVSEPAPPPARVHRPEARPATRIGSSAWMPRTKSSRWQGIVVHHTANPVKANMATIDRSHKARGWDGCGYHFVIGNGTLSGDGEVEVGPRWPIQKHGAHVKVGGAGNWYNEHMVGVVCIGNFMTRPPSSRQLESAHEVVLWLMQQYGIPYDRVYFHRELSPTLCPGDRFPRESLRRDLFASASRMGLRVRG